MSDYNKTLFSLILLKMNFLFLVHRLCLGQSDAGYRFDRAGHHESQQGERKIPASSAAGFPTAGARAGTSQDSSPRSSLSDLLTSAAHATDADGLWNSAGTSDAAQLVDNLGRRVGRRSPRCNCNAKRLRFQFRHQHTRPSRASGRLKRGNLHFSIFITYILFLINNINIKIIIYLFVGKTPFTKYVI